jgi:hypothetical protein
MGNNNAKRIGWIDDIKVVAGLLMLLDHTLLYSGLADSWPRYTITRCVEPLYVFAFGYRVSINPRSFSLHRWLQVVIAATLESAIHSHRESELCFGILTNLVVVMPFAPWIVRLSSSRLRMMAIAGFGLSALPVDLPGVHLDYGLLVIAQVAVAGLAARRWNQAISTVFIGWSVSFVAAAIVVTAFKAPCENFWTLIVGHPLALTALYLVRRFPNWNPQLPYIRLITLAPLRFYIGHLCVLHYLRSTFKTVRGLAAYGME